MIRSELEDDNLTNPSEPSEPAGHARRAEPVDDDMSEEGEDFVEESTTAEADAESGDEESEEVPEEAGLATPDDLQGTIEAVLFSTSEPVTVRQLAEVLEVSIHDVREAVENLRLELVDSQRAFRLNEIGGGLQLLTEARFHPWVAKFHRARKAQRLSPASMETLSVIAYKQPISKAGLEGIRGVQCGPTLKTLMDRGLIRIVGREDSIGKPLLYGTTPRFLESFGIGSIKSLPHPELDGPDGGE